MFQEVERTQTSEKIVEMIVELISQGKLKPGEALPPERVLAQQLGVSRVALREAITSLGILGIVEKKWGKGNFISENVNKAIAQSFTKHLIISKQLEIFEIMEARLAVESEIAALAAARRTEDDIEKISKALNDYLEASRMSIRRVEFDKELHNAIAKAAKNKILEDLEHAIMSRSFEVIKITTRLGVAYKNTEEEHKKIVEAILEGNPERARKEMHKHIVNAIERIFKNEKNLEPEITERLECLKNRF